MRGYPLFLNLQGKSCVVFGGGKVAYRKVQALLERGARVTCVSKDFCEPLRKMVGAPFMAPKGQISAIGRVRANKKGAMNRAPTLVLKRLHDHAISVDGARLVIAATSDRSFNERIARLCRRKKIFINVVDDPELCDWFAPAIVRRGPLQIAISTGGTSPGFAKRLRQELERAIPSSVGRALEKVGRVRRRILSLRGGACLSGRQAKQ